MYIYHTISNYSWTLMKNFGNTFIQYDIPLWIVLKSMKFGAEPVSKLPI